MDGWKRLVSAVLLLAFVGGFGIGAFVGRAGAAPTRAPDPSIERRLDEYRALFRLDPSQSRRAREILGRHDEEVRAVQARLSEEQFREIQRIHDRAREEFAALLDPEQRKILQRGASGH